MMAFEPQALPDMLLEDRIWHKNLMTDIFDVGAGRLGNGKTKCHGDSLAGDVLDIPWSSRSAPINCWCCASGSVSKRLVLGCKAGWEWRKQARPPTRAVAITLSTRVRGP